MARILVVDDNQPLAEDLAELLSEEGHETVPAFNPSDALRAAEDFAYDAALVDIRMPEMDGVTLVRKLMATRPCASYIFMTAFSSDNMVNEALALSAGATLSKPLDLGRLSRLMSAVAS